MCESNARRAQTRTAHRVPDERRGTADCRPLSGEVQDNQQIALVQGNYSHVHPQEYGRRLSDPLRRARHEAVICQQANVSALTSLTSLTSLIIIGVFLNCSVISIH